MKYYIVQWNIRDSENEYFQQVIIKTELRLVVDNLFIKTIEAYYGYSVNNGVVTDGDYQLENDYRIIKFKSIKEINKNIAQLGKKHFGISIIDLDELDIPF